MGQVLASHGADRYLLDQVRDRLDFPGTLLAVRRLSAQWPDVQTKLVEDKANGPAVVQSLRHEIGGFVEVNPEGGKESRAAAASPQLESGNWYLPHPLLKSWVEAFIGKCAAFPNGANDDQVDAWSQGAKRLLRDRAEIARPLAFVENDHGWHNRMAFGRERIERSPEKAGVGGSIPSLATIESIAYRQSKRQFHSVSFQKLWSAETRISDETWRQDRSEVLSIPPQLEAFARKPGALP